MCRGLTLEKREVEGLMNSVTAKFEPWCMLAVDQSGDEFYHALINAPIRWAYMRNIYSILVLVSLAVFKDSSCLLEGARRGSNPHTRGKTETKTKDGNLLALSKGKMCLALSSAVNGPAVTREPVARMAVG